MTSHLLFFLHFFRRMKVRAALKGNPIPLDRSILRYCTIGSACMIFYVVVVALVNFTITEPFLPQYAVCMNSSPGVVEYNFSNKIFAVIPFTVIIGTNILFDFEDISIFSPPRPRPSVFNSNQNIEPILYESPLRTSFFSLLFVVLVMCRTMFLPSLNGLTDIGIILIVFFIKGPLIAIWTIHQQKSSTNNQQKMDDVELSISLQREYSQLENPKDHVSNVL